MAVKIVETILKVNTEITEPAQVETLLDFVKPLIADIPGVEVDEEVCLHQLFVDSKYCAMIICYRVFSVWMPLYDADVLPVGVEVDVEGWL